MSLDLDRNTWKRVAFGDVVRNVNISIKDPVASGIKRVIAMEHLDPGELKISRWGTVEDGTTFTRLVKPGQTLFGKRRAYQRKAAFAEFEAITSGDILVFEVDSAKLLPRFLPFLVQSEGFYDHALGTSAGSLSPRTNWRDLSSYEFDLPPLEEQERLANLLWAVERHQDSIDNRIHVSRLARGTFVEQQMRAGNGTTPLNDVIRSISDGPFGSKIKTEHYSDQPGVRVLRLKDVALGRVDDSDVAWLKDSHAETELSRYRVHSGDVVIAGLGDDAHPVGRAALIDPMVTGSVHKADIFRVVPDTSRVLPRFLVEALNADSTRIRINERAQGTTRLRINTTNIRKVEIPSLSLSIQECILRDLGAFDTALGQLESEKTLLQMHMASLVSAIFGGAS